MLLPPASGTDRGLDSGLASGETVVATEGYSNGTYDYGFYASPTSVTLKWFRALARPGYIKVGWETAQETDNLGFNLYRSLTRKGPKTKLNAELIPTKVPPGSPFGAVYSYRDTTVEPGKRYFYWLESVDLNGVTALYGPAAARTY